MTTSVLVLCWNELNVARDSVRRLLKEPGVDQVVLVDNGSTDGSAEYFSSLQKDRFQFVGLPSNLGPSVGRNKGIGICTGDRIFLIDGDILYVPGTLATYHKILDANPDAFCVGQSDFEHVMTVGHNGVLDPQEAELRMPEEYTISDWFPMAWTQYGLFVGDLLREVKFYDKGAFGEQGYGLEDDWFYHDMKARGLTSLSVNKPVYYHEAHTGIKEIIKASSRELLIKNMEKRRAIFYERWGNRSQWSEWVSDNLPEKTTRPKPV